METKSISFDTDKVKKGKEGEEYIARVIADKGFQVIYVGGAVKYAIDETRFFCSDLLTYGNKKSFWIQIKNKEPRIVYPDTGLEMWRFEKLKELQEISSIPLLLLFTDSSKKIYGNWIDELKIESHPSDWNYKDNCQMLYFWKTDLKDLEELI